MSGIAGGLRTIFRGVSGLVKKIDCTVNCPLKVGDIRTSKIKKKCYCKRLIILTCSVDVSYQCENWVLTLGQSALPRGNVTR